MKSNKVCNYLKNCTNQLLETFKKTVYPSFKDNICGTDLADIQSINIFNKGNRFYCVSLIFLINIHGFHD